MSVKLSYAVKANLHRLDKRLVYVIPSLGSILPRIDSPPQPGPPFGKFRNFVGEAPGPTALGFLTLIRGFFSPRFDHISDSLLVEFARGLPEWNPLCQFWDSYQMESPKPALWDCKLEDCYIPETTHELIGTTFGVDFRKPPVRPHKCACGAAALVLFRSVECSNEKCKFFVADSCRRCGTFCDCGVG